MKSIKDLILAAILAAILAVQGAQEDVGVVGRLWCSTQKNASIHISMDGGIFSGQRINAG